MTKKPAETIGAVYLQDHRCRFRVWAPEHERVGVRLLKNDRLISMERTRCGYHEAIVQDAQPGDLYFFQLEDGNQRADPASRLQPQGVHGPSAIVNPEFSWADQDWRGIALKDYIIYELHVGSFTAAGTFAALTSYLDYFSELGVTAIELDADRAIPRREELGLRRRLSICRAKFLRRPGRFENARRRLPSARLGGDSGRRLQPSRPGGKLFSRVRPVFHRPVPDALGIRRSISMGRGATRCAIILFKTRFIGSLIAISMRSGSTRCTRFSTIRPLLFSKNWPMQVHGAANRLNREIFLIAESADNDRRLVRAPDRGGYGLDAQWNDDFHHCLRTLLTGERSGYYRDYGDFNQFVKAYREGFAYSGEYSKFRRRRHGSSSRDLGADRFVVFAQNHDQVGNRMRGDRLSAAVSFEDLKLAAGIVLLSPYLPLLFMGEEYAESAPFPYFISHSDAALIDAVRRGRQSEFAVV